MTPRFVPRIVPSGPSLIENGQRLGVEDGFSVQEFLTEEFYEALVEPGTQAVVNEDAAEIAKRLYDNSSYTYPTPEIDLSRVDVDHDGLSAQSSDDKRMLLVPGLIGLQGFDEVSAETTCKRSVIRLYCGLMLTHGIVQTKYTNEKFFKLVFDKTFQLRAAGAAAIINSFEYSLDDPVIQARHRQITLASFASSIAITSLFPPEHHEGVIDLLRQRHDAEVDEMLRMANTAMDRLLLPASRIHQDEYPTETRGFAYPVDPQIVQTVLLGRLSH